MRITCLCRNIIYFVCLIIYSQNMFSQIIRSATQNTIVDSVTISKSGKYILGRNITGPIIISTNDVTLDLQGYIIDGGSNGISIANVNNITVYNGTVRNSTNNGIIVNTCQNLIIHNIAAQSCGLSGIKVQNSSAIKITECISNNNASGIFTSDGGFIFSECTRLILHSVSAIQNRFGILFIHDSTGTFCITSCIAQENTSSGIRVLINTNAALIYGTITQCEARQNTIGIDIENNSSNLPNIIIEGNKALNNTLHGITVAGTPLQCAIVRNIAQENTQDGIRLQIGNPAAIICVKENIAISNGMVGIFNRLGPMTSRSFLLNKAQGNGTNFMVDMIGAPPIPAVEFNTATQTFSTTPEPFDNISVV